MKRYICISEETKERSNIDKMRKTWVKRENMYYKPFYKQKLKMTMLAVILMAIIFLAYQIFYIKQLQIETELERKEALHHIADVAQPVVTSVAHVAEHRIIRYSTPR